MPEVLIMAEDGCNGPRQRRGPLLIPRACNGQYEKGHILILLLSNFNREYSVGTFDEQKQ